MLVGAGVFVELAVAVGVSVGTGVADGVFVGVGVGGVFVGVDVGVLIGVFVGGGVYCTWALIASTRKAFATVPVFKTPISRAVEPFFTTEATRMSCALVARALAGSVTRSRPASASAPFKR